MNEQYGGFYNYETWCFKLWLDNEESTYRYLMDVRADSCDELEQIVEQLIDDTTPKVEGVWGDLIERTRGRINAYEIAEYYWEDRGESVE